LFFDIYITYNLRCTFYSYKRLIIASIVYIYMNMNNPANMFWDDQIILLIRQSRCFSSHQIIHILDASCTICRIINEKSVETPRVHTKRGGVLFICLYIVGCRWLERGPWHDSVDCAPTSPNRVYIIYGLPSSLAHVILCWRSIKKQLQRSFAS
jgi:hypothetical protein